MEFEKFLLKLCPVSAQIAHHQLRFTVEDLQAAYTAGMLRAAEIADNSYINAMVDASEEWFEYSIDVAEAIREEAKGE